MCGRCGRRGRSGGGSARRDRGDRGGLGGGGGRLWTADSDIPSLDDADVAEEGKEVDELREDAVVEVATPALTVTDGRTGLEGSVGLVQTEGEEFVLHVVLGDAGRGPQDTGGQGGQGAVLYPGNLVQVSVGGGPNHAHVNIRLTAVRTVTPLALTPHVFVLTVSQGGAPGDPVVSVHQGAAGVLLILEDERKDAGSPGISPAHSDAARGRFGIYRSDRSDRSDLNVDRAALGSADPPTVGAPATVGALQPAVGGAGPASLAAVAEVLTALRVPAQGLALRHRVHLAGVGAGPQVSPGVVVADLPAVAVAGTAQSSPDSDLTVAATSTVLAGVRSLGGLIFQLHLHLAIRTKTDVCVVQYLTHSSTNNSQYGVDALVILVGLLLVVVVSRSSHCTEQLAEIESNCKGRKFLMRRRQISADLHCGVGQTDPTNNRKIPALKLLIFCSAGDVGGVKVMRWQQPTKTKLDIAN